MINRKFFIEWLLFALLSTTFCILLSFRPIPSEGHENDTGRYVREFRNYCYTGSIEKELLHQDLSFQIFYTAVFPACLIKSDRFFLLEVSTFVPLAFLLFAKWRNGTFFLAASLTFSVFGLELMTNAMRQGFATLLFLGSVGLMGRHRKVALLMAIMAGVAHISALAFFPFLLWISWKELSPREKYMWSMVLPMVLLFLFSINHEIIEVVSALNEMFKSYKEIYSLELKKSFLIFMLSPLYWIFAVRYLSHKISKINIEMSEKRAIIYSSFILVTSYLIFPYIIYRIVIFAVPLQIFLAARSSKGAILTNGVIFFSMVIHLIFMIIATDHFDGLLYG
ncbi:MAG: EpsG family protein [candidate division WOR-3 bacterium]